MSHTCDLQDSRGVNVVTYLWDNIWRDVKKKRATVRPLPKSYVSFHATVTTGHSKKVLQCTVRAGKHFAGNSSRGKQCELNIQSEKYIWIIDLSAELPECWINLPPQTNSIQFFGIFIWIDGIADYNTRYIYLKEEIITIKGAIPHLFERLFVISWENNRDCHITMPLSLKTMEVQIQGDQWIKRFRIIS